MTITQVELQEIAEPLNQLENYASFKRTWVFERFIRLPHQIIGLFTGNQFGKTSGAAYQYVMRIMGMHPVPKRNVLYLECSKRAGLAGMTGDKATYHKAIDEFLVNHEGKDSATWGPFDYPIDMICPECGSPIILHKRKSRIFRFASESLPVEKENLGGDTGQSAEISNTQYPEIKKWLPRFLIKKDISIRRPALTISDPLAGMKFGNITYPGADIIIEFQSYNQSVQREAGVQRLSVWLDEESPFDFFEEQVPRLIAEDGDIILSVTPAIKLSWSYDEIFEKARFYVRTQAILDYYKEEEDRVYKRYEITESDRDIAVIQAATDDNPTLSPDVIDDMYKNMPDPDGTVIATRRYGIFKQATGRIFKDFRYGTHGIDFQKHGITHEGIAEWNKAHSFDFHTSNPHAIIWAALSPRDELFIYDEWNPSPHAWVTERICEEIASRSGVTKFSCSLIDPLANTVNTNTGKTTVEEMNIYFNKLKLQGRCGRIFWEPFATRGDVGRDVIKLRLANSLKCERPFNNEVIEEGAKRYLPTIWISKHCRNMLDSLRHWRLEVWATNRQLVTKERKEKPIEKWSHFCTALEGLLKEKRFRPRKVMDWKRKEYNRFQGRI